MATEKRTNGDAIKFTKDELVRLVGLDGKIDVLTAKFDAFTKGIEQQIGALIQRDNAQAEKIDAVVMRVSALEGDDNTRKAEARGIARAWSVVSVAVSLAMQGVFLWARGNSK